ncbi:substrate-binding domain-containing protein [Rhizobium sp. BK060]|uniref:substrate-binding domain-containing protein n=1 Tax=Rhizobium sp. BK060 TaxID=2587096 RepID=UPI00161BF356|nr:substrate-binding domain-containing protein [Rhizobium sp. BK060]MBB3394231.1 D-xylose transport system substrate-binding protein [Rhizobium sp. BK060]
MVDKKHSFEIRRRTFLELGAGATAAALFSSASSSRADVPKIGFALETFQIPRWKYLDYANFKKAVEGAGMELIAVQPDSDAAKQLAQVQDLITSGCKAIAIAAVVGKAGVAMVRACKKAGVPVIAYNTAIPSADVAAFLSRDTYRVGQMAMEAAASAGVLKGNWVIVSGEPGTSIAEEQTKAYLDGLDPLIKNGSVKLVSHQYHTGWSAEGARSQVENALTATNNDIQGVLCNNDQMAIGCLVALQKAGVAGKVFLNGLDATTEACRAIEKGEMTLSAFTKADEMGRIGGEMCVKLAKGESLGITKTYDAGDGIVLPWYPIDSINVVKDNMVPYLKGYSPFYVDAKAVFKDVPQDKLPQGAAELLK